MKKWLVILVIAVIAGFTLMTSYNGLVKAEEQINSVWANVETQYQRRTDLIPNLVNTVKGQANFERDTLTAVIDARSKASQIKLDPANMTQEQLNQFQKNNESLFNSQLSRLLVTVERYPDLKATKGYQDFQVQLEGTENRINKARNDFNIAAKDYNQKVRQFPTKLVAMLFGFKEKPYFKAQAGAENAPVVNFN